MALPNFGYSHPTRIMKRGLSFRRTSIRVVLLPVYLDILRPELLTNKTGWGTTPRMAEAIYLLAPIR